MQQVKQGKLVLADGSVYEGALYGKRNAVGEVCFTTGMGGYQETLTDPTFCGQIVVMTYPLIGNYGVSSMFNQGRKSYLQGYVIGELCDFPSNWRSERTLEDFLDAQDVPTLVGVDTRAITRKIRNNGVMKGVIVPAETSQEEIDALLAGEEMHNQVATVSSKDINTLGEGKHHVAVLDLGIKKSIMNYLLGFDCHVTIFPADTTAEEILRHNPDGIFISNGPGNPQDVPEIVANVKKLIGAKPIFAVGLGHQVLALANGADTYKMKFGHRGVNQPVKDLRSGRVYITGQNHGYALCEKSLEGKNVTVTHVSMNDASIEGLEYAESRAFSVQYHPADSEHEYLFKHFVDMMEGR